MSTWDTYYKKHTARKPREQLVRAVSFCKEKEYALDLGAGTLIESVFLLENDFKKVIAVDNSTKTKDFAVELDPNRFTLEISSFQDFKFKKEEYDLINAQYSLPFYGSNNFSDFIKNIVDSLKHGGIFLGQFFGVQDSWNTPNTKLAFQTKEEAQELLTNLEILEFTEEEYDGKTANGDTKHWHVFHFIVKK